MSYIFTDIVHNPNIDIEIGKEIDTMAGLNSF